MLEAIATHPAETWLVSFNPSPRKGLSLPFVAIATPFDRLRQPEKRAKKTLTFDAGCVEESSPHVIAFHKSALIIVNYIIYVVKTIELSQTQLKLRKIGFAEEYNAYSYSQNSIIEFERKLANKRNSSTTSLLKSFKYNVLTPRFSSLAKEIDQAFTKTQNFNIDPLEVLYVRNKTRDLDSDRSLRNNLVSQEDIKDVINTNLPLQDRTAATSDTEIHEENKEIDENTENVNPDDLDIITIFENLTITTESRRINKGKKREDFKEETRRLLSLEYPGNSSSSGSSQNASKEFYCESHSNQDGEKDQVSNSSTITKFVDNFLGRDNDQRDNRNPVTFFPYQEETDKNDRENSTSPQYQDFRDSKNFKSSEEIQKRQKEQLNRAIMNQDQLDRLINALTGGEGSNLAINRNPIHDKTILFFSIRPVYVPIPEYKRGEQDPIRWICQVDNVFVTNNTPERRKLAVFCTPIFTPVSNSCDEREMIVRINEPKAVPTEKDFRDSKNFKSSEEIQKRQKEQLNRAIMNQDQLDRLINALTGGEGSNLAINRNPIHDKTILFFSIRPVYVPIPEYKRGEQDPIRWICQVDNVFVTNNTPERRKLAVFCTPIFTPVSNSCDEREMIVRINEPKAVPTEKVDQFYNALNELWIKLEDEQERYPEVVKTHIFINELKPELSTTIAPFMNNILEEAVERAKAFEIAFSRNREPTVVTTNSYLNSSSSNSIKNALAKLVESVNTIMAHLDKREASLRPNNYNNYNYTDPTIAPINNTNNTNNNNPYTNGEDVQGLLAMLNELRINESNGGSNASSGNFFQENNSRQSFLNEGADPVVTQRKKSDSIPVNGDKAKEAEPQIVVDFEEDSSRENLNPDVIEKEIEPRKNKTDSASKKTNLGRRLFSDFLLDYTILHRHQSTKQACEYHIWAITLCRPKFETRPSEESPEEENGGLQVPIDVVVTDASFYYAKVGNDWLAKVNVLIEWNKTEMIISREGRKMIIPVEFKKTNNRLLEDYRSTSEIEDDEEEHKESDKEKDDEESRKFSVNLRPEKFPDVEERLFAHSELENEIEDFYTQENHWKKVTLWGSDHEEIREAETNYYESFYDFFRNLEEKEQEEFKGNSGMRLKEKMQFYEGEIGQNEEYFESDLWKRQNTEHLRKVEKLYEERDKQLGTLKWSEDFLERKLEDEPENYLGDIFDFYFDHVTREERKFELGLLEKKQSEKLNQLLDDEKDLFAWNSQSLRRTDLVHFALRSLFRHSAPKGCLVRWILTLQDYSFDVVYKPGKNISMLIVSLKFPIKQIS
ncbi:hypothetical protein Glove_132g116 [Diversispora epigaea]|uniref:Uncharacterized protein n=1 Tax=Diversispora epigaea TaxID=1348612 RepID=A0A397J683_9GLOM|nr:hypothetical protein Glove_132g116 [Diversispora epigaea]